MKRAVCVMAVIVMLTVLIVPSTGFAAVDEELEEMLVKARQKYDIPEESDFNYSIQTLENKKVWNFYWSSRVRENGSLEIRILEDGSVISYYRYVPYTQQRRRLPSVAEEAARQTALEFIEEAYPEILPNIRFYKNNSIRSLHNYYYNFTFVRVENGIPFYTDVVNVSINHQTGEVTSYNLQWSDAEFPKPNGVITQAQANNAYKDNIGMEITYRFMFNEGKTEPFAVYTPVLDSSLYAIDAFTGEAIKLEQRYRLYAYDEDIAKEKLMVAAGDPGVTLSPEELEALEEGADLLNESEAVMAALKTQVLELDDSYELVNSMLSRRYLNTDEVNWRLYFTKDSDDRLKRKSTNVTIDAFTGEVKGFGREYYTEPGEKAVYDRDECKQEVERFLSWFAPERYAETEYMDKYNYYPVEGEELPACQQFTYTRVADGTPCPDNGITVMYDAVNGKVTSYDLKWYDADFPSLEEAVPLEEIYENFFGITGLELQYKADNTEKQQIRLVYALTQNKPYDFDVFTGEPVYGDGTPWKEDSIIEYTDVDDSYAKDEINTLGRYGIGFEGGLFRPREEITQLDFFILLSGALDGYYGPVTPDKNDRQQIDDLYEFLLRRGIVTKDEWNPEAEVARDECAKFVVRSLGYGEVAALPGIYKTGFADEEAILEGLTGHVAIAGGLGIMQGSGSRFNPRAALTQEQAAVVIYNYLTF